MYKILKLILSYITFMYTRQCTGYSSITTLSKSICLTPPINRGRIGHRRNGDLIIIHTLCISYLTIKENIIKVKLPKRLLKFYYYLEVRRPPIA